MAKPELTIDQKAVVSHDGGALLVSAAAGSGKTKVLVDRLLRKACDPVSPCNVDDFLIITYTKAAATELRNKIAAEISSRLSENSENRHLRNQLSRIYLAEISTVHSFCSGLLRNYAYMLDIPGDFRVAEQAECMELSQKTAEKVLLKFYEELPRHPEFSELLRGLGHGRDDRRLTALVLATFDKLQCHADPAKWLQLCRDAVTCKDAAHISDTIWGNYLLREMQTFLQQQLERMERANALVVSTPALEKYVPVFSDNLELLRRLHTSATWETFHSTDIDFGRLPAIRNCEDPETQNLVKNIRETCKSHLLKRMQFFSCGSQEALEELQSTQKPLLGLLAVVESFADAYAAAKRQRHLVDYSDLEHLTIRLLTDRYTGAPTVVAREISARFREIMVDEYQDSNEVQDTIFRAVSKDGRNLFMVGDVKQSIYRFRLANPDIFLEKYRAYAGREIARDDEPCKILLSTNFRSDADILHAVNHVFYSVMSEQVGDLEYGEAEALRTIREFPPMGESAVELHCIDSTADSDAESHKKQETEAKFVAKRIRELVDGTHYIPDGDGVRPIRPEDVVILLRSVSSNAPIFTRALAQQGLSCTTDRTDSVLDTTEFHSLFAWLQILDNPHQDIPLVTAMASPLGGFSADEMAKIRIEDKRLDLFDALLLRAEHDEKSKSFVDTVTHLRGMRRWMGLTEFFDEVCREIKAFYIFSSMGDGAVRTANLQSIRSVCQNAESMGIVSLSGFVRYVENLKAQNSEIPAVTETTGGVTIMSIHKSKGLEFPVVFLCDLSRSFNVKDISEPVLLDKDLFVGCNVMDNRLMMQYPSAAKYAIAAKKKKEMVSEELRVLYVAMTRAKHRLIMTYCADHLENKLQKIAVEAAYPAAACIASDVSNPGQWVLLAAAVRPEASFLFGGAESVAGLPGAPWLLQYHSGVEEAAADTKIRKAQSEITASVNCVEVAANAASAVPAKLTATQLKGRSLDKESAEDASEASAPARPTVQKRLFTAEVKPLTAAQRGTATHLFMQFCNYENCADATSIETEIRRLVQQRFLTQEQADAVDAQKLLHFFTSELGRFVLNSHTQREFKFSLLTDAAQFFPDVKDEKIMLQGVIDCFVVSDDGITVVDYKTDNIRPGQEQERALFYKPQLTAYSAALERIYSKPVVRRILYFFATNTACEV